MQLSFVNRQQQLRASVPKGVLSPINQRNSTCVEEDGRTVCSLGFNLGSIASDNETLAIEGEDFFSNIPETCLNGTNQNATGQGLIVGSKGQLYYNFNNPEIVHAAQFFLEDLPIADSIEKLCPSPIYINNTIHDIIYVNNTIYSNNTIYIDNTKDFALTLGKGAAIGSGGTLILLAVGYTCIAYNFIMACRIKTSECFKSLCESKANTGNAGNTASTQHLLDGEDGEVGADGGFESKSCCAKFMIKARGCCVDIKTPNCCVKKKIRI